MKSNEKRLVIVLAVFVGGFLALRVGWPMVEAIFITPTHEARRELERAQDDLREQKYALMGLKSASKQLADWKEASLPPNPTTAQRLYIRWLRDIATLAGLNVVIEPGLLRPAAGTYSSVQVQMTGRGTYLELKQFLEILRRVDLLHRIVKLDVGPVATAEGDPPLPIEITLEGICLNEARRRENLFRHLRLSVKLASADMSLPRFGEELDLQPGDRLRLGDELIAIREVGQESLRLQRGVGGTRPADHEADSVVVWYPSREATTALKQLAALRSPFVIPHDYQPKFDGVEDLRVVRGESLQTTVAVADSDPRWGRPTVAISGQPEGMAFDPATGELTWAPGEQLATTTYHFQATADFPNNDEILKTMVSVAFVEPDASDITDEMKAKVSLVGITREDEAWEAWLWDRTEGKRVTLRAGRPFEVIGLSGMVVSIGDGHVVFQWHGRQWRMELGQHLGELVEVPVSAPRPPAAVNLRGAPVVAPRPAPQLFVKRGKTLEASTESPATDPGPE